MISVIIPAYNEEENIKAVIDMCKINKNVSEIIVVNNLSTDRTEKIAKKEGAKVISCDKQGKGYAMKKGLKEANNEIIVFLDGDINNYTNDVIEILTKPILEKKADFVKASFNRHIGGIVTEVVTKPLLEAYYPELLEFTEPLSGMIASKKSILEDIDFEEDYGVDIGILIDIYKQNKRIVQVNIGDIENSSHKNKTIEKMKKMSTEIMRAILKRVNNDKKEKI